MRYQTGDRFKNRLARKVQPYLERLRRRGILLTRVLGCGGLSCVHATQIPGVVVKWTDFFPEAKICHSLIQNPQPFFPRIYQVFRLGQTSPDRMYFIVREDLDDINLSKRNLKDFEDLAWKCECSVRDAFRKSTRKIDAWRQIQYYAKNFKENSSIGYHGREIIELYLWALKKNRTIYDTMNLKNWGMRDGVFVFRDLGF